MWNLNDFCIYTGVSKQYAYQLTSTGQIKFYRPLGKLIYFDAEDVIEFLKQNPIESKKNISTKVNNNFYKAK